MKKVDVGNFMGVIAATEQTEDGIKFPGEHMPSGNPVVSEGVSLAALQGDKDLAMQWHESIRSLYEREKGEINNARSKPDLPELTLGGEDRPAPERVRAERPAPNDSTPLEEELQGRYEAVERQRVNAEIELATLTGERDALKAALDAIRDV